MLKRLHPNFSKLFPAQHMIILILSVHTQQECSFFNYLTILGQAHFGFVAAVPLVHFL